MEDKEFDKHLKKAITSAERKRKKAFLQTVETTVIKPKKRNWFVAASIFLLVGLGGYFYVTQFAVTNEKLFIDNYSAYENVVAPIVRSQIDITKKEKAFAYYEEGNYSQAIEAFDQLTANDKVDITTINFYKANAYLALHQLEKSKTIYTSILTSNQKDWKPESKWYLALIALKQHKNDEAKSYLLQLKDEQSTYNSEAIDDLLDFLD